ncbi:O-antigen ligase family protein [Knoellia locipacati]|uniref:O-antigen ligase family protein n=1 Tax=Knoellia locipacati TaxID=882824 RepID=UPI00384AEEC8
MRPVRSLVGWPEAVTMALLALWVAWSVSTAVRSDWGWGPALPYVLCPVALAAGVAAGVALRARADSPALRIALLVVGAALVLGVALVREPGKAPLGYPNANAAAAVQVLALAGLALLSTPTGRRRALVATGTLCLAAIALNRSAAGVVVAVPVCLVVAVAVWRRPWHRGWSALAVVVGASTAVMAAVLIVRAAQATTFPDWAETAFDPVREQLWHDAVSLWRVHPVAGSGPGAFSDATALSPDPDTMSAHSSVLQVGAETGWVGVALLALVGLAGLLWAARGRAAEAVIACAAWTALLVHSTADHLIEFGTVVVLAGAVLGWAGASRTSEQLDVAQGEGPLAR